MTQNPLPFSSEGHSHGVAVFVPKSDAHGARIVKTLLSLQASHGDVSNAMGLFGGVDFGTRNELERARIAAIMGAGQVPPHKLRSVACCTGCVAMAIHHAENQLAELLNLQKIIRDCGPGTALADL